MSAVQPLLIDLSIAGTCAGDDPPTEPHASQRDHQEENCVPASTSKEECESAQLKAMFPDFERDVIEAVLQSSGNAERAVSLLLEMTTPAQSGGTPSKEEATTAVGSRPTAAGSNLDADEELAMALFKEFAESLDQRVPEHVRADPQAYDAFVRENLEKEMTRKDSPLSQQTSEFLSKIKLGSANLFAKIVKPRSGSAGFSRMGEESISAPLIMPVAEEPTAVSNTRSSAGGSYAPPSSVLSPLTTMGQH